MERSAKVKAIMLLLHLAAIMALMPAEFVSAADATTLQASEPYTVYYTTNGATPAAPIGGTTISSDSVAVEPISLVPNAGRGTSYVKPQKLKIHESKQEFEKHVKEKHGKRFRVETFRVTQTEYGPEGHVYIIENRDPAIIQLAETCNEDEWARRVAISREFIINNLELIGLTENEELRVRTTGGRTCLHIYFDRYVNDYEGGTIYQVSFSPQNNYSISADLSPITPEMYVAAQQQALTEDEIRTIVYKDLNIPLPGTNEKLSKSAENLKKMWFNKYIIKRKPYVIWEVRGKYLYEINALTGEILNKNRNIKK